MGLDAVPGNADMLFDCIRVTWVFMIICILVSAPAAFRITACRSYVRYLFDLPVKLSHGLICVASLCLQFFEMNLSTALWSGIIAGIGYAAHLTPSALLSSLPCLLVH